jgi:hypothetical protein
MAGLLDFWGSMPDEQKGALTQGLLAAGFGAMAGRGTRLQAIGQGGIAGLLGYSNAMNQAQQARQDQQRQRMQDMQIQEAQARLEDMNRARQTQEQVRQAALGSYQAPQQMPMNEMEVQNQPFTGDSGMRAGRFDTKAFVDRLYQIDPMQALAMEQQLAKREAPISVKEGETLLDAKTWQPVYQNKKAPDLPTAIREYEYARQQGYPGSFNDWELSRRKAGATNLTVGITQEKEENKAVGKFLGEQYADIQKAGINAQGKLNRAQRMEGLLQNINTGKLAPASKEVAALAQSLGVTIDPNLPAVQAFEALSNEMALEARNPSGGAGMPGAMSDKDREFLQNITPNLSKTPEGNRLIIETHKRLAKRDADVARLARQYRQQRGTLDEGFFDVLRDYSEQNPLFGDIKSQSAPPAGDIDALVNKYRSR